MTDELLERNRTQFGANAANYATSEVHAKGASLGRLVEVVDAQSSWDALDIATAAGHVAITIAPMVSTMTATDLTPEMVELAEQRALDAGLSNLSTQVADAGNLPFNDATFDLVTCRIAPHHFPDPAAFVTEVARVLRSGGVFGFVDNVVPDESNVATFVNDWERRRDPSHLRCLSVDQWLDLMSDAGLRIELQELLAKRMDFVAWANNMSVPVDTREELRMELAQASEDVHAYLRPENLDGGKAAFHLTEAVIRARKP